jgi:predicted amidohydrolase
LKLAVAQAGDIGALMRRAAAEGARLIQFHEGAASGYPKTTIERAALHRIADLAGELRLWTVVGCSHPLTPPNLPHNSLYVFADDGSLHTRYDKRLISNGEMRKELFSPGRDAVTFEVDGFRFGLAICIEIQFPEVFGEYELLDVDCVLFSAWSDDPMYGVVAQGHAATSSYWVGFSVPASESADCPAGLIAPSGAWQARCRPGVEDVVVVDLDRDDPEVLVPIHAARPWRRTARRGDVYRQRDVGDDPRSVDRTVL